MLYFIEADGKFHIRLKDALSREYEAEITVKPCEEGHDAVGLAVKTVELDAQVQMTRYTT